MLNLLLVDEVKLSKLASQDELESMSNFHLRTSQKTFHQLNQRRNHLIDQIQPKVQITVQNEQNETCVNEYQGFFERQIF